MNKFRVFAVLGVLVVVMAGCGDKKEESSSPSKTPPATTPPAKAGKGTTLDLAADPDGALKYDKTTLTAPAGKVTVVLKNDASFDHDVEIEGNGVEVKTNLVKDGATAEVTATLKPGKYEFYCTVPGHRQGGMEGTLTVE